MKKNMLFFTVLVIIQFSLSAQTRQIPGKVTDDTGSALPGVTVLVKGSKTGVQTRPDGSFTIPAAGSGKISLVFSYTGYKPVTINTDGAALVSVKMEKDVSSLEDVVVIGYQSVRRKNLLASVSSVGAKDLKDIPLNSAAEALNGRLAGVTATTAEGSPDAQIRIRVRGGMSITGDNSPLFIVDGVQVENALSTISPQDIQTIDVLKDAAATAIYGARGANGVFVITTKSGKPGKLVVSYNGFLGIKKLPETLAVLDPYDYVIYQSERSRGSSTDSTTFTKNFGSTWDTLQNYKNVDPVDWQDEVFGRTGITQTHNVSASGGSKKLTYNFGYTYNNDKAIVINSNYKRHLLNAKADYNISSKIKLGLTGRYTHQDVYGAGVSDDKGSSYNRLRNAVKYRPFLSANQDIEDADPLADANVGNGLNLVNPLLLANAEYRKKTTDVFNLTANASISITKNLSFRSVFGYTENKFVDRQFSDSLTPYSVIQGGKKPIAGLDTST
ncbi:MAG TPA: SusC/RagA family TonB-linked outer membrane protein, partial [Chitinophagaceae bacterium]|nr:SusC/RagA family TonB-linked outer membrane protein [Chitinophagaceae bacterium]